MTDEQLKRLIYALGRAVHRSDAQAKELVREAMRADVSAVAPTPPTP